MRHDIHVIGAEGEHQGTDHSRAAAVSVVLRIGHEAEAGNQELDVGHDHDRMFIGHLGQGEGEFKEVIEVEQLAGIKVIAEEGIPGPVRADAVMNPCLQDRAQILEV